MTRETVSGISILSFLLRFPGRTDQVPSLTTVNILFVCLFVCLFADVYVTTSLYNCVLEVSVDDDLSQVYNNAHMYTLTHTLIIYTPTHLHKVFPTVY